MGASWPIHAREPKSGGTCGTHWNCIRAELWLFSQLTMSMIRLKWDMKWWERASIGMMGDIWLPRGPNDEKLLARVYGGVQFPHFHCLAHEIIHQKNLWLQPTLDVTHPAPKSPFWWVNHSVILPFHIVLELIVIPAHKFHSNIVINPPSILHVYRVLPWFVNQIQPRFSDLIVRVAKLLQLAQ